jgi:hypothetical protein
MLYKVGLFHVCMNTLIKIIIVHHIYIVYLLEALSFQRVIGSLDPTPPFGSTAPPQTDQASSFYKSYPRPPRIRVSARQQLRAGGYSATAALRASGSSACVAGRAHGGCRQHGDHAGTCCRCWSHPRVPDLAVPRGAVGLRWLQRLRDVRTNVHGRADPTRTDHDGVGRHASAWVWRDPMQTGHGSGRRAVERF